MTRRGGPYPHLRVPLERKVSEGIAVWDIVAAGGSISEAARTLDMSVTTAWRRYHFLADWTLPRHYGQPNGPIPPQRGTRACPNGRPYLPTLDGEPSVFWE